MPFAHTPGVGFEYSNLGYALLGRVVERLAGRPFHEYVTESILLPIGMHSTVLAADQVPAGQLAAGYWGPDASRTRAPTPRITVFAPGGGLYTSMRDYARYIAFQLSAYPPRDEPERGPVRRSTLREMHQGQRLTGTPDPDQPMARRTASGIALAANSYGLGWFNLTTCNEEGRLEHAGWEPGYHNLAILLPQHRFAIVTMATGQAVGAAEAALRLIRDAGALPPAAETNPSPALHDVQTAVIALLTRWDPATVDATFAPALGPLSAGRHLARGLRRHHSRTWPLRARRRVARTQRHPGLVANALRPRRARVHRRPRTYEACPRGVAALES